MGTEITTVIPAKLLGLATSRFDILEVWDPNIADYINVAGTLDDLKSNPPVNAAEEARIQALEDKVQTLDQQLQQKATKFVAVDPLNLDETTFPNQLSQTAGPTPASASAINFNGEDAYIELQGRTCVLDYTKDWSIGCSIQTQGYSVEEEGHNMVCFSSGGCSLNLKVQNQPNGEGSNWGLYTTSNADLYHVAARANSNAWASPADESRLLWVYDSTEKKLAHYISYADGPYSRKANISIPQTYIDAQTPGPELAFSRAWSGTGGVAFSGSDYEGVLTHWVLSPHAWADEELVEYFASPIEDLPTLALWDKVSSFIVPGVYPVVKDIKGNLTDGALINGEPSDFLV